MPFEPGKAGNPEGSAPRKIWIAALNRAIAQDDGVRLRAAAEKLLDMAAVGDISALKELGDRLDGKPAQALVHAGDPDGAPIASKIELVIVDAKS